MKKLIFNALISLVSVLGMSGAALFLAPVPAYAAYSCPVGLLCVYDGTSGSGTVWQYSYSGIGGKGKCISLGPSQDNKWTSFFNNFGSGVNVAAWTGYGCAGSTNYYMYNGVQSNFPSGFNNDISSFILF